MYGYSLVISKYSLYNYIIYSNILHVLCCILDTVNVISNVGLDLESEDFNRLQNPTKGINPFNN